MAGDAAVVAEAQVLGPHAEHDLVEPGRFDGLRASAGGAATRPPAAATASVTVRAGDDRPATVFIGGLPMKRATKRLAGRS